MSESFPDDEFGKGKMLDWREAMRCLKFTLETQASLIEYLRDENARLSHALKLALQQPPVSPPESA